MSVLSSMSGDVVGSICDAIDANCLQVNSEVEEEELASRYGDQRTNKDGDSSDSGIQIFRPDDSEIVARYSMNSFKAEPDIDDEIILNHPDDDDVVKRYASYFQSQSNMDEDSENRDIETSSIVNDEDTCNATVATSISSMQPSPVQNDRALPEDEDVSDCDPPILENEVERSSNITNDSCTDMSDLERIQPGSPSQLSVGESDSLDGLEDGGRAAPECSSHNRSITFYNLCCNKEIFSSISIDSPVREALRGLSHRTLRRGVIRNTSIDTFQTNGDCCRYNRKPRNRSRSRAVSRNENLVCVIHKLERIAQTIETHCIQARRSLRKNCSQGNMIKTGGKLKTEVTPLLNSSLSLLRKVRPDVP